jgi:hypothetical protein
MTVGVEGRNRSTRKREQRTVVRVKEFQGSGLLGQYTKVEKGQSCFLS